MKNLCRDGARAVLLATTALAMWTPGAQAQSPAASDTAAPAAADPAGAAAASAPQPASVADAGAQPEILVTARKRAERLIDVPVAITVFDNKQLARYGTTSLQNLSTQVPQVLITPSMGASTGASVTIRGFGSNASADNSIEQAVSFNIDGVSAARGRLITQALFDLSDVQVLKGPQALYFGKNSPAGVIVVTSAGPGSTLSGYVKGSYEFRAREYHVEGAVGGPLTDSLGVRLAFFRSDMAGGYVRNIAGPILAVNSPVAYDHANGIDLPGRPYKWGPQSKQTAGRLTIVYNPGSRFNATLKFIGADYRDNGDSSTEVDTSCPVGSNQALQVDLGAIIYTGAPGLAADPYSACGTHRRVQSVGALPAAIANNIPGTNGGKPFLHNRAYLGSATLNYTLEDLTFTSVTGYFRGRTQNYLAADTTAFTLIPSTQAENDDSFSQELRVNSSFSGRFNFTAGAFYSHDKLDSPYLSGLIRASDPVAGGNIYTSAGTTNGKGHSISVFGEARVKITPEIELTGGARYTDETKTGVLFNTYVQPGLASLLGVTLPAGIKVRGRVQQSNVSPQATITWHPTHDVSLYAAYRTGFKSGGVTHPGLIPATATPATVQYTQEKVRGYEAGLKFQALDRRLTGDFAIYDFTYTGLQVSAFNGVYVYIQNAGGAEARGVEGTLNYRATDALSLRSGFGYNKARYSSFPRAQCYNGQTEAQGCVGLASQNLTGAPLPRAPNWVVSGGADYDRPITNALALGFSFDARYSGSYFLSPQDSPFAFQKSYTLLDATIRLHDVADRWELALIARNLTDKYYAVVGSDKPLAVSPGSVYGALGLPRTVTLQASFKF